MSSPFAPSDEAERARIRESLNETLFVEAGAGTGKTTSLVDRVVQLVSTGKTTLDRIAAITFTEAAAAELRNRIRDVLEEASSDRSRDEERRRCEQGVHDLDQASIQTLHGFARSLLAERPLEAGLPPSFEVMDPIASDLEFEEVWRDWIDAALDGLKPLPTLPMALSLGLRPGDLREIALGFHSDYDLVATASFDEEPMPRSETIRELIATSPEIERLCQYSKIGESDKLFDHAQRIMASTRRLAEMVPQTAAAYGLLSRIMPIRERGGRQGDWMTDPVTGENACKHLKAVLDDLHRKAVDEFTAARVSSLVPILGALRDLIIEYATDRKRRGRASFHDLLVWARDLLRDDIRVRDHFRQRFTHLLIDEAQDTDPIQAEIAMFLAEDPTHTPPGEDRPANWGGIVPEPGKLFVVGDPKQSIYRFRRADVRQMARLQDRMGGDTVRLLQNFRSQQPVLAWVNHVFDAWMKDGYLQPEYVPLTHRWMGRSDLEPAPAVWSFGEVIEGGVDAARREEVGAIARLLGNMVEDRWPVLDRPETESSGVERYRPARFSDICILMPTRTDLWRLEIALDSAGIPYRLEGASFIFDTQEVRDLVNCLRAVDDPADQVSIVAALRSPAFACTDVDLLRYYESGGRFGYLSKSVLADGPVAVALSALREYHDARLWASPAALIERIVRDRFLMEIALDHPRTREQWRRYSFMVERARAFIAAGGASLRGFLEWVDRQREQRARITEAPVPDVDEEAVRIMTVHGAKGLEFPIVILTGLNTGRSPTRQRVLVDREDGRVEVNVGTGGPDRRFTTPGYQTLADRDKSMDEDENVRLLYVAATRARDHLAVSAYRGKGRTNASEIARLMDGRDDLWQPIPDATPAAPVSYTDDHTGTVDVGQHSAAARDRWLLERGRLIGLQGRPASVAATTLARIDKQESESEEPWKRGRGGTSLGRAVHAVLQTVDLATGDGIDEVSRSQADAERIPERRGEVAGLVRAAVESDIVRRAVSSRRLWREAAMAVPVGDGVLEGYIDLLFEEPDGLVVVDYKTDSVSEEDARDAAAKYRVQAGAYALMVQQATSRPVKEIVFLFLRPRSEQTLTEVHELADLAESLAADYFEAATR